MEYLAQTKNAREKILNSMPKETRLAYQKNPLILPYLKKCGLFVGFLGYRNAHPCTLVHGFHSSISV